MRTLTLTMSSILFSLLMMFTSCSKEMETLNPTLNPQSEVSQELIDNINSCSNDFISAGGESRIPIWLIKLVMMDAIGAIDAHNEDGSTTGSTVLGAVKASLTGGLTLLEDGSIFIDPNLTNTYTEKTVPNVNNPFNNYGVNHNMLCASVSQYSLKKNVDLNQAFLAVTKKDIDVSVLVKKWFSSNNTSKFLAGQGYSQSVQAILLAYINSANNIKSTQAFQAYTTNIENLVIANTKLNPITKESVLIFLSVAKYSSSFWSEVVK